MRDVYEILRAKEILIEQLRREIEALRLVAPLLNDDRENGSPADLPDHRREPDAQSVRAIKRLGSARLAKESDREGTVVTEEEMAGTAQRVAVRLRRLARPVLDAVNSMAG